MRKTLARLALLCAVACSSGCGLLTVKLRDAGLRHEEPEDIHSERGPVLEAYADAGNARLCVKYHVGITHASGRRPVSREGRWLNLSAEAIARALSAGAPRAPGGERNRPVARRREEGEEIILLSESFLRRRVSGRPQWDISRMAEVKVRAIEQISQVRGGADLGLRFRTPRRCYYVADLPGAGEKGKIAFWFPRRRYRTAGGRVAQLLVPVTAAVDIVTFPIQFLYMRPPEEMRETR